MTEPSGPAGSHEPTDPPEPLTPAADPYLPGAPIPVSPMPAPQDYPVPLAQGYPPYPQPYGYPVPPAPRKKSKALKIVLISLAAVLLLCVSGSLATFIVVRNAAQRPSGASSPDLAATNFLNAFYRTQDPAKAKKTVCAEARDDKAIAAQIDSIKKFSSTYSKPSFTWGSPKVSGETAEKATIQIELTMTTEDMKASKQQLTLDAVQDKGWWICAVHTQG